MRVRGGEDGGKSCRYQKYEVGVLSTSPSVLRVSPTLKSIPTGRRRKKAVEVTLLDNSRYLLRSIHRPSITQRYPSTQCNSNTFVSSPPSPSSGVSRQVSQQRGRRVPCLSGGAASGCNRTKHLERCSSDLRSALCSHPGCVAAVNRAPEQVSDLCRIGCHLSILWFRSRFQTRCT